jgi:hypothetical protein
MPVEYQTAVWTALRSERDPYRLRMFGDRMRELNMHRSAAALHNRAAQMEHGGFGHVRGHGAYAPTPHTVPNGGIPSHPSQW